VEISRKAKKNNVFLLSRFMPIKEARNFVMELLFVKKLEVLFINSIKNSKLKERIANSTSLKK